MTSDTNNYSETTVVHNLLLNDEDTLITAPLILGELRRAQGKPVSADTVFKCLVDSLARPYTSQEWYDYFITEGQFSTARRLQTHVQGVGPSDLSRTLRERRDKIDVDVARLRDRVRKQRPVLGAGADTANEYIVEAQQLAVEGWIDLANEHLEMIRELLRETINTAIDERKQWFKQAQERIYDLRVAVIDHEQELFENDTYELVWELLHYADKISAGRTHDLGLIDQISETIRTLFQGGQADEELLASLREQFQTVAVHQALPTDAAASLPTLVESQPAKAPPITGLLSAAERSVLTNAIGPGTDVIFMNLSRVSPLPAPAKREQAAALYDEAARAARSARSNAKTKARSETGSHVKQAGRDAARHALEVEGAARRLLRYLAEHRKVVSATEERYLRNLIALATDLRAWGYLVEGAWESAALYYRLAIRIALYKHTDDSNYRETVFNYFASILLRQPAGDSSPSSDQFKSASARYGPDEPLAPYIDVALAHMLVDRGKNHVNTEAVGLALWELGKETDGLRREVLAVLDKIEGDAARARLLEAFYSLAEQASVSILPELGPQAEALIDHGLALDNEREARLLQLQDLSLTPQTLAEVAQLLAELQTWPLWGRVDSQLLAHLQTIVSTMERYFDPRLTFSDRDPLARDILQEVSEAETILNAEPTRWMVRYLGHVLANLQSQVEIEHSQLHQTARPRLEVSVVQSEWRKDGLYYCHLMVNNLGGMRADDVSLSVTESLSGEYDTASQEQRLGALSPERPVYLLVALTPFFSDTQEAFTLFLHLSYAIPGQTTRETRKVPLRVASVAAETPPPITNVFVVGSPITDPNLFKGRAPMIQKLVDVVSHPAQAGSIVLYGQKRSGKTSILLHLIDRLEEATPKLVIATRISIDTVLHDMPYVKGSGENLGLATARLLLTFCQHIKERCEELNRKGDWNIQCEVMEMEQLQQEPGPGVQFSHYLKRFKQRNPDYRLLLMLDEFTALMERIDDALIDGAIMRLFKSLIDDHLLSFVICGLNKVMPAVIRYANQLAASTREQVNYLDEAAAAELIREPLRLPDGRDRFNSAYEVREIFNLTAGNPFYTQIIGQRLVSYLNEQGINRVTMADLTRVVAMMTAGSDKLGPTDFDNLYRYTRDADQPRDVLLEGLIVHLIAHETASKDYVQSTALYARMKDFVAEDEFDATLERLVTNQTIVKESDDTIRRGKQPAQRPRHYRLSVDLFRRWLLANHPIDDAVLKEFARKLNV